MIITQDDHFVIPRNLEKIRQLPNVSIGAVITLDVQGALSNKKLFFAKGFGLWQAGKMAVAIFAKKIADRLDKCFGARLFTCKCSIGAFAQQYGIPYWRVKSVNSESSLSKLREIAPDLVVSFSAPCIFKTHLLEMPPFGCINLHCSLLPSYAGLLPSFWVLYKKERETGATVHYMDDEIDNGAILGQCKVSIGRGMSMFELIDRTKLAGGKLVCDVIQSMQREDFETIENDHSKRCYHSWPTHDEMQDFRRNGGRLI